MQISEEYLRSLSVLGPLLAVDQRIAIQRGRKENIGPSKQRPQIVSKLRQIGADHKLLERKAFAAFDHGPHQIEPERRFAALKFNLDRVRRKTIKHC